MKFLKKVVSFVKKRKGSRCLLESSDILPYKIYISWSATASVIAKLLSS